MIVKLTVKLRQFSKQKKIKIVDEKYLIRLFTYIQRMMTQKFHTYHNKKIITVIAKL